MEAIFVGYNGLRWLGIGFSASHYLRTDLTAIYVDCALKFSYGNSKKRSRRTHKTAALPFNFPKNTARFWSLLQIKRHNRILTNNFCFDGCIFTLKCALFERYF